MNSVKKVQKVLLSLVMAMTFYLVVLGVNKVEAAKIEGDKVIVEKGDTLYTISEKANVKVEELISINDMKDSKLTVGQVLKTKKVENTFAYEVQKGDTLSKISKIYNIKVGELKSLNALKSDNLKLGQVLNIPKVEIIIVGKITVGGLADGHTIELYDTQKKEYFCVQVTQKQIKDLKNKKKLAEVVYNNKTTELVSFK